MATRAPPPSSTGSVTMTIDPSPLSSAMAAAPPPREKPVVLQLNWRAKENATWKEGTVHNESLGCTSSKKSCIFHREVPFDEDCSGAHQGTVGEWTSRGAGGCSFSHGHGDSHRHHN